MSIATWWLVFTGVALNAGAQLFLKAATAVTGPIAFSWSALGAAAPRLLSHYGWWAGLTCYGASVVIWVIALSRAPVSIIYPMLSLGYILNAVAAMVLFDEPLSASKVAGILIIVLGVYVLTQSRA